MGVLIDDIGLPLQTNPRFFSNFYRHLQDYAISSLLGSGGPALSPCLRLSKQILFSSQIFIGIYKIMQYHPCWGQVALPCPPTKTQGVLAQSVSLLTLKR
jgi:hypothetical protein